MVIVIPSSMLVHWKLNDFELNFKKSILEDF